MDDVQALRREMVQACKDAYALRLLAGTSGNLSVRLEGGDEMLITPTSVRYGSMEDADIVRMRFDGTVVEGRRAPSSEWRMHAVVYERMDEARSVFHTHSPYATAFAANRVGIPYVLVEMGPFIGGALPCARLERPGTRELGLAAVERLAAGAHACLLASHGVLAVGKSLAQAFLRAEYVEDAARIYHLALQVGEPAALQA